MYIRLMNSGKNIIMLCDWVKGYDPEIYDPDESDTYNYADAILHQQAIVNGRRRIRMIKIATKIVEHKRREMEKMQKLKYDGPRRGEIARDRKKIKKKNKINKKKLIL